MAKRRKIKKQTALILGIILFFVVYTLGFLAGDYLENRTKEPAKKEEEIEDTRSLMTILNTKDKIYISDSKVENVKIEETYWSSIKVLISEFSKIRNPENYTPVYTGYSDDGIRFSTDLNYLRIYTVSSEEYYKIPVVTKDEFELLLGESIYLSFDFIKQYKSWNTVEISCNGKTKKVHKWKFDDLSYKMASKRIVGKVQPEKNKERSEYNFVINIKGEHYDAIVETMGKEYVKISQGQGENQVSAYYEVHTGLYEYIATKVFKIEEAIN